MAKIKDKIPYLYESGTGQIEFQTRQIAPVRIPVSLDGFDILYADTDSRLLLATLRRAKLVVNRGLTLFLDLRHMTSRLYQIKLQLGLGYFPCKLEVNSLEQKSFIDDEPSR